MNALPRMIDANANRAGEALRVMEDCARFALDDANLASACKSARHDLRQALEHLPPQWLLANRDTPGDVGTTLQTRSESDRAGLADIASAAAKRAGEALRVIEESLKTINAEAASTVESIRYRTYDIDKTLALRLASGSARQWRVCVLLTESLCRLPWLDVARAAIDAGVDCIQLREKHLDGAELIARARALVEFARPAGTSVIINDRADIALASGADGVHLGQNDMSVADVRTLAGRALLVGVSTHDTAEAARAVREGADYCGVGAMFSTQLKPDRTPSGPAYMREFARDHPHAPHLAIGGITPDNVHEVIEAGAQGVAVSTCVCASGEPRRIVDQLNSAFAEHVTA